jgi:F-type H+-transporting ATPase subunit a
LYESVRDSAVGQWFGFAEFDAVKPHAGQFQFEGMCFAFLLAVVLAIVAIVTSKGYQRIPSPFRNLLEASIDALRGMIRMLMGKEGDKYLPYLGTLFIYILLLNLLGLFPLGRSPTMALSTTFALGITTFVVVQYCGIKSLGLWGYFRHLMGPVVFLAPLMLPIEIIGEMVKPCSLSLRLAGNIGGEDTLIEQLMHLGGVVPIHIPILLFAVFTSFLQAFIFTALSSIYIQIMTSHGDDH